jgi:hypothetical protein
MVESGADRDFLRAAVQKAAPGHLHTLEQLFKNVDGGR